MQKQGRNDKKIFQVLSAVQQSGFVRTKRGLKQIRGVVNPNMEATAHNNNARPNKLPNDPLYSKEWYIVSNFVLSWRLEKKKKKKKTHTKTQKSRFLGWLL